MKWVTLVLVAALAYVHFHLWLTDDGVSHRADLQQRLDKQQSDNAEAQQRNIELKAELKDLNEGGDALGELSRFELGYVAGGETFYRIVPKIHTEQP